jgi:hypothetical protein
VGITVEEAAAKDAKGAKPKKRQQSARRPPSRKKGISRPHSISLADLFLWITLVDECLFHPIGAFERAAVKEGLSNRGTVTQRVEALESRFGQLFAEREASQRYRSGVPSFRGAALAEIFVLIEHLYRWALEIHENRASMNEVRAVKPFILHLIPAYARRPIDESIEPDRIMMARVWVGRLSKAGGRPGKLSIREKVDLPSMPSHLKKGLR